MHGTKKEEYKCDLCEKTFASKSNLNRHIETKHSDTEPQFECSECEKALLEAIIFIDIEDLNIIIVELQ